ncbi:MAG: prevent-host-death protein [Leptospira sp.]|nr:prevent-host-death protein [Leptospira sp.]
MKSYPVGEFKSIFSHVLELIKNGEEVEILFGRNKKPIAKLIPINTKKSGKRKIGILKGKSEVIFKENFKMTEDELLGIR